MRKEKLKAIKERYPIGTRIKIYDMLYEPHYSGQEGVIEFVDDEGQLHGTWGGCALIPDIDTFEIIKT